MYINNITFYCYLLAIIFTPFEFFMFQERNTWGISLTFSKFFQLLTYSLIIIYFLFSYKYIKIQSLKNFIKTHKFFLLFILTTVISTIFGFINDSYNLKMHDLPHLLSVGNFSHLIINFRPILEILIELHKYFFFIILAPLILSNEKRVNLVLKILFIVILFNLLISFVDYALTFYHYELIPRHMIDWRHVGNRLHGFFGEPRDAYLGLVFSLCFVFVYNEYYYSKKSSYFWASIFILSLFFTNSTSGLIGSMLFSTTMLLFSIIKPKKIYFNPQIRIWLLITLVLMVFYFLFSIRYQFYFIQLLSFLINLMKESRMVDDTSIIILYLEYFKDHYELVFNIDQLFRFDSDKIATHVIPTGHTKSGWGLQSHQVNLLPIIQSMRRLENFEIWQIVFGTGSNSISFYNNESLKTYELSNSHSKFINVMFNYGISGTFLLIYSMWYILKSSFLFNSSITKETQIGVFLVIMFSNFIHDGYFCYLIVGLLIVSNRIDKKNKVNL